jgi:hypothetical protein
MKSATALSGASKLALVFKESAHIPNKPVKVMHLYIFLNDLIASSGGIPSAVSFLALGPRAIEQCLLRAIRQMT